MQLHNSALSQQALGFKSIKITVYTLFQWLWLKASLFVVQTKTSPNCSISWGKLEIQIQLLCSNNMFSHCALQSFQAGDLNVSRPNYVYHNFPTIQKFQVVPLGTHCPWSYQTNCSQSWGFHPRRQRRYTDYLSPPQSLTNLVTCTALSYLSSQSIHCTSLLDWNQDSGCCQSLFNPQLTHPKTLLLELGFCMLMLKNDLFNNL